MKNNKWMILIGFAAIALISILLIFLPVTPHLLITMIFAIAGVIGVVLTSILLSDKKQKFYELTPFIRPFIITALLYLLINVIFSVVVNILSQHISWQLFLAGHLVILVIFFIRMMLLSSGKEYIQAQDTLVQSKVKTKRIMQADLDQIIQKAKTLASESNENAISEMQSVADALKYSDPMVNNNLLELEMKIQEDITLLGNAVDNSDLSSIPNICQNLKNNIANRNLRIKLSK